MRLHPNSKATRPPAREGASSLRAQALTPQVPTVTLSRTTALATSAPAFPGPPRGPGYAADTARPRPSVEQPTVRTDRDGAPIPSAYVRGHRDTSTHGDTLRYAA